MAPAMHSRRNRLLARGTSAVLLAIGALALVHSLGWRGARFPGFFVMPNRVVPSAALPGWSGAAQGRPLSQNILLAVDAVPRAFAADSAFLAYGPGAYGAPHNHSQALAGIPVVVVGARLALAIDRPPRALGRAGLRRMLAGTLAGLIVPAIVLGVSGATGGRI